MPVECAADADRQVSGELQREGARNDYTYAGRAITFSRAPMAGDFVTVQYYTV